MFSIGIVPALLAVLVMRRLKEPERWQKAMAEGGKRKGGSMKELFVDPRWRKNAIVGLLLATSGVIGLWGIGFFSFDLNQSVFRKDYQKAARDAGEAEKDRQLVAAVVQSPECFDKVEKGEEKFDPKGLLTLDAEKDPKNADLLAIYDAALRLRKEQQEVSAAAVLDALDQGSEGREPQSAKDRQRRKEYVEGTAASAAECPQHVARMNARQKKIDGDVRWWGSITSILFNIGGFFGVYVFSRVTQRIGRKPAFAISFVLAAAATAMAFLYMSQPWQVYWMVPTMGFCIFLLFGGYAIYFAELFPTRLRSTGTSFCYNIGRYLSAVGVWVLGLLTSMVYAAEPEPLRYAGVTMCACFLVGLVALWFAPETKGKPLPE
jgi:hypothetical protein